MAYAKAINKQQTRTGSLFQKNFKAKIIDSDIYYTEAIFYIHSNPQRHGLIQDFPELPYSSYAELINNSGDLIRNSEAIKWYGSMDRFLEFHQEKELELKIVNDFEED